MTRLRDDHAADSTADVELGCHAHPARRTAGGEFVKKLIRHRFIEDALIAEAVVVELQRFKLDAKLIGDVLKGDLGEIGVARLGADARELGEDVRDRIVALGSRIGESFEHG